VGLQGGDVPETNLTSTCDQRGLWRRGRGMARRRRRWRQSGVPEKEREGICVFSSRLEKGEGKIETKNLLIMGSRFPKILDAQCS